MINKNGNAVLSQADPEKQKRKEAKAAMYALGVNKHTIIGHVDVINVGTGCHR